MKNIVPRIPARLAITLSFLLRGFILGSWAPRIPGVASAVEISEFTLGTVLLMAAVGNIIAFNVAAKIISHIGSARSLALFALPLPFVIVAVGLVTTPFGFATGLLVFGFLSGGFDISSSVQGAVVEQKTDKPMLSTLFGLFSVGALVGAFTSGLIAQAGISLSFQFAVLGIVAVPVILFSAANLLTDGQPAAAAPTRRRFISLPPRVLWPLGLMIIVIALGEETINNWVALFMRDYLGASPALAAAAYTAFSIATAAGRLLGDNVLARYETNKVLMAGSLIAAFGVGFGMAVNQSWAVVVGYTFVGLGLSVAAPLTYRRASQIPGISPERGVATVASIGFVGFLIGPLLIGTIADLTSLRIAISIVGVILLGIFVLARVDTTRNASPVSNDAGTMTGKEGDEL